MMSTSLFDVATGESPHLYEGRCPDYVNGPESRDPDCPACQAIAAAEAQQERLLQDMHDAGREVDRVMAEAAPKAVRLNVDDLSNFIRAIYGNHQMGAGQLAENIAEYLARNGIEVAE